MQRPGMHVTQTTTTQQSSNMHPPQYPNQQYPNAGYPNTQNQYYPSQYSANEKPTDAKQAGTFHQNLCAFVDFKANFTIFLTFILQMKM